jgi:hypothetical protein
LTVRVEEESVREALALEAAALRDAVADPAARAGYDELARALADGAVTERLAPPFERLLELTLRTGRVRRLHGPHAEAAAIRLYQATPAGRAIGATLAEVNAALGALRGRTLEGVAFTARAPGTYLLALDTPGARLTLEIGPEGVAVRELGVSD